MLTSELDQYLANADRKTKLKSERLLMVRFVMSEVNNRNSLFVRDHMLMFVLQGKHGVATPEYFYEVEAGEAIFVRKNAVIVCEKLRKGTVLECLLVFLEEDFLASFIEGYQDLIAPTELINVMSFGAYQFRMEFLIQSYLKSVEVLFDLPRGGATEALVAHKFKELLLLLISGQERTYFMSFLRDCLVKKNSPLDSVVESNVYSGLSVEHLANLANLSTSQFKRDFKKRYQESPAKWLRARRLEYAVQLLVNTDKNINEICQAAGFNNTSHFCRTFTSVHALSPLKFRQKHSI